MEGSERAGTLGNNVGARMESDSGKVCLFCYKKISDNLESPRAEQSGDALERFVNLLDKLRGREINGSGWNNGHENKVGCCGYCEIEVKEVCDAYLELESAQTRVDTKMEQLQDIIKKSNCVPRRVKQLRRIFEEGEGGRMVKQLREELVELGDQRPLVVKTEPEMNREFTYEEEQQAVYLCLGWVTSFAAVLMLGLEDGLVSVSEKGVNGIGSNILENMEISGESTLDGQDANFYPSSVSPSLVGLEPFLADLIGAETITSTANPAAAVHLHPHIPQFPHPAEKETGEGIKFADSQQQFFNEPVMDNGNSGINFEAERQTQLEVDEKENPGTGLNQPENSSSGVLCTICSKPFPCKIALMIHNRNCHPRSFLQRPYCAYCQLYFPTPILLRKHNNSKEHHSMKLKVFEKKKSKGASQSVKVSKKIAKPTAVKLSQEQPFNNPSQVTEVTSSTVETQSSQDNDAPTQTEGQPAKQSQSGDDVARESQEEQVPVKPELVQNICDDRGDPMDDISIGSPEIIVVEPSSTSNSPPQKPSKPSDNHSQKRYYCQKDGCSNTAFSDRQKYREHKKLHAPGSFKCNFCRIKESNMIKLAKHESRRHVDSKKRKDDTGMTTRYPCARCNASFKLATNYYVHFADAHMDVFDSGCQVVETVESQSVVSSSSEGGRVRCTNCGQKVYPDKMEEHWERHHDNLESGTMHRCSAKGCRAYCRTQEQLRQHKKRMHPAERRKTSKSSSSSSSAYNSYKCDKCKSKFANIFLLNMHVDTDHKRELKQGFKCRECGALFKTNKELKLHMTLKETLVHVR